MYKQLFFLKVWKHKKPTNIIINLNAMLYRKAQKHGLAQTLFT